jgi:hypothetical protein
MKDNLCPICLKKDIKVSLKESIAIENSLNKPFAGDGVTVSKTGSPLLVTCQKCPACGHSVRKSNSFWSRIFGA